MNRLSSKVLLCFIFLIILVSTGNRIHSQTSVSVTARVGATNLLISGKTSRDSSVTIIENDAVVGTTISDETGSFSKELLALEPGIYTMKLYSVDPDGNATVTLLYTISLTPAMETALWDVILPPTFEVDTKKVNIGDDLKISGYSIPNAKVRIYLNDELFDKKDTTSDGKWTYYLNTSDLKKGEYEIYLKAEYSDRTSERSESKTIKVSEEGIELVTTPTQEKTEGQPVFINPLIKLFPYLDKDGDGKIDPAEIYDYIKTWIESFRGGNIETCDLNDDGRCNLIDFSIVLFYIGR